MLVAFLRRFSLLAPGFRPSSRLLRCETPMCALPMTFRRSTGTPISLRIHLVANCLVLRAGTCDDGLRVGMLGFQIKVAMQRSRRAIVSHMCEQTFGSRPVFQTLRVDGVCSNPCSVEIVHLTPACIRLYRARNTVRTRHFVASIEQRMDDRSESRTGAVE